MSIQAVAWVLDHSRAAGVDRLVLISLANHANHDGECWPSQRTIAREAGLGKSTISLCVKRLVALGELVIHNPGDNRHSARYVFTYQRPRDGLSARVGAGAAPAPGAGRIIKNHQEPSSARVMGADDERADQPGRFPGELAFIARCPKCRRLSRDCACHAAPPPKRSTTR